MSWQILGRVRFTDRGELFEPGGRGEAAAGRAERLQLPAAAAGGQNAEDALPREPRRRRRRRRHGALAPAARQDGATVRAGQVRGVAPEGVPGRPRPILLAHSQELGRRFHRHGLQRRTLPRKNRLQHVQSASEVLTKQQPRLGRTQQVSTLTKY